MNWYDVSWPTVSVASFKNIKKSLLYESDIWLEWARESRWRHCESCFKCEILHLCLEPKQFFEMLSLNLISPLELSVFQNSRTLLQSTHWVKGKRRRNYKNNIWTQDTVAYLKTFSFNKNLIRKDWTRVLSYTGLGYPRSSEVRWNDKIPPMGDLWKKLLFKCMLCYDGLMCWS